MRRIGEYKIGYKLGEGKESKCYLATKNENKYCMKMLKIKKSDHKKQTAINKEVEILEKLKGYDLAIQFEEMIVQEKEEEIIYCIFTELMKMNLEQYLKSKGGKLSEKEAKKIFKQILEMMDICHGMHLCHQDIKLENVMIDPLTLKIKIIDFGYSILSNESDISSLNSFQGSPSYISPEKYTFKPYDGTKSDVWSCGILLYRILFGDFPFPQTDFLDLSKSILSDDFKVPFCSDSVHTLLLKMLDKDPFSRLTISSCLLHPWFKSSCVSYKKTNHLSFSSSHLVHYENKFCEKQSRTLPSSY